MTEVGGSGGDGGSSGGGDGRGDYLNILFEKVGEQDMYGGIKCRSSEILALGQEPRDAIQGLLTFWKQSKRRGIWMRVAREHIHILQPALELGFQMHHAQKEYVQLTAWLADEPSPLPHYASSYIGVGGLVVDTQGQVLVVQEKYAFSRRYTWKLPGGLAEPGEDISAAAMREVKEETGIDTAFVSVLGFRHLRTASFGCSDMYFIVLLRPLSDKIEIDPKEIAACEWQDLNVFATSETTSPYVKLAASWAQKIVAGDGLGLSRVEVPNPLNGSLPPMVVYSPSPLTLENGEEPRASPSML